MQCKKQKMTALALAAQKRNWKIVKWLTVNKSCVNIPNSSGWYPVHATLEENNEEMLDFFMKNGVDIYDYKKITNNEHVRKRLFSLYTLNKNPHCKTVY